MIQPFVNEPLTDFSREENHKAMLGALAYVKHGIGAEYDLVVGGERLLTDEKLRSINPARPDEVVGIFQRATLEIASKAVDVAHDKFQSWQYTPATERSRYLIDAAHVMRKRKNELSAWMVLEVGKSWVEADADTAEAIDFLEFYARENLRLAKPQPLTEIPTEDCELRYIPLGAVVVIPPWNFPLAILAGMTSAAIVAGNTVVLKPSSDSPTIGRKFFEIMEEVGLPEGVLNFVTGSGATVGDTLVMHPKTRMIAFTGSKEVGLGINEKAAGIQPGQIWIRRVIAEMGGKDAIIVDRDADLEPAVEGVASSAFGYQGQKCSACSRAVIDQKLYDTFLDKLKERTEKLQVGPTDDPHYTFGPVINRSAMQSILGYIDKGVSEGGRLLTGGGTIPDADGYFVQPTIIADVDPKATIAQEEIFGPVLAVHRAKDFDEALNLVNDTEYGLTGSVYTESRDKIDLAKKRFHVGNLYFNRKCTGALVGVHPFGGFNMSGTDSKAGGRDYLLLFTQAKSLSEKTR
jgi:1-pyrroline-5-carboxylate dehydrogenase